jgi:hypothetical protein
MVGMAAAAAAIALGDGPSGFSLADKRAMTGTAGAAAVGALRIERSAAMAGFWRIHDTS